jgi:hypothetical protein
MANRARFTFFHGQIEIAPTTSRRHLQGYFETKDAITFSAAKKLFESPFCHTLHIAAARKSGIGNVTYCSKSATRVPDIPPLTWGTMGQVAAGRPPRIADNSQKREREDTNDDTADAKSKKPSTMSDISCLLYDGILLSKIEFGMEYSEWREQHPDWQATVTRNRKQFLSTEAAHRDNVIDRNIAIRYVYCEAIYGEPGTGKSTMIAARWTAKEVWRMVISNANGSNVWFDGYEGQPVIVVDDYDDWLPPHYLMQLADGQPLRLPIKGGSVRAVHVHLVVISNKHPRDWCTHAPLHVKNSLKSRFTRITLVSGVDLRAGDMHEANCKPYPSTNPDHKE